MMVHSLVMPVTGFQLASLVVGTEMVDEYVPIDPHMVEWVPLSLHMDEY